MSDTSATSDSDDALAFRMDDPLSIEGRDYLAAAASAATRTRNVTITLVALSVVMFVGVLNSLAHSWAGARILISRDVDSAYVQANIGPAPDRKQVTSPAAFGRARTAYEERYRQFYSALMRSYVETGFAVRVPFFGVAIDVNDLGVVGGFAFLIVLFMFDYSLRRERENVNVALAYAFASRQLRALYDLLAMHQLFTTPRRYATLSRPILTALPKLICFLPVVVQGVVVGHDLVTNAVGEALDPLHNTILLVAELVWLGLMFPLTVWVVIQMIQIDRTWSDWADVRFGFWAVRWSPETKMRKWAAVPASKKIHISQLRTLPMSA